MAGHRSVGRLLFSLMVVLLLVGCASGTTPSPSPTLADTPTPTPNATPTSAPTAIPTPITYGPVTVVSGTTRTCLIVSPSATIDPSGVEHARGGSFTCTVGTDDPRVSGTHTTSTWDVDRWMAADQSNGASVQWATVRLWNDGGAWEGRATGVFSPDRGDTIVIWYKGTGGYAGLSYFALWTGYGFPFYRIQGQIFPGDPPTP